MDGQSVKTTEKGAFEVLTPTSGSEEENDISWSIECVRKSGVGGVGVGWAHASDNTLQTPDFTSCSAQR
jgi:hypothetical protein